MSERVRERQGRAVELPDRPTRGDVREPSRARPELSPTAAPEPDASIGADPERGDVESLRGGQEGRSSEERGSRAVLKLIEELAPTLKGVIVAEAYEAPKKVGTEVECHGLAGKPSLGPPEDVQLADDHFGFE